MACFCNDVVKLQLARWVMSYI